MSVGTRLKPTVPSERDSEREINAEQVDAEVART